MVAQTKDEQTPLQVQIKQLSWWLGAILLGVTAIVIILGLIKGMPFYEVIIIGIALAVAAIPEGLLVAVTIILAIGMQRMLKRKALVRHLVAAETLGSVSIICTDKTGTLTQGHMQVVQIATQNETIDTSDTTNKSEELNNLLRAVTLNNDAQLKDDNKSIGNQTEIALLKAAESFGLDINQLNKQHKRISEIPFSSDLKYMVTKYKIDDHDLLIAKGAPERIFKMCKQETLKPFISALEKMAQEGLRTLAVATKQSGCNQLPCKKDLQNLTCIGVVGIQDPLIPEAKETVKDLKDAGIHVVLVTGDHKVTATNIASNAGIMHRENGVITGEQLDKMTDENLKTQITDIDIFARVDPRHKIRIVKAWQSHKQSVAMIGDGVNDAPALKAADIGVALGSGSDVAHEISDIVLLDNNLSTIDAAVKEGRTIFDNIRKIIVYLLSDCFSQILLISLALVFNLPLPLLATQILWINLMSDGFPYLALTIEPAEDDIMSQPPRKKEEHIVS